LSSEKCGFWPGGEEALATWPTDLLLS